VGAFVAETPRRPFRIETGVCSRCVT